MSSGVVEVCLYTLFLFIKVCRDSVVMCCCRRDSVVLCCCCRVVLAGARPCDVSDNGLVGIVGVLFFPLFLLFPFFPFGVFCVQKDIYTGKFYSVDCF